MENPLSLSPQLDASQAAVIIEDIDIHNEKPLRKLVHVVEHQLGIAPETVQLAILNTDQWQGVIKRFLGHKYRGAAPHIHFFVDPTQRNHLFVSPSGVRGVGEGEASIISEAVYGALAATGAPLQPLWSRGVHDYFAQKVAQETRLRFQDSYHPREEKMVDGLIRVLKQEHGHYKVVQWYQALKRTPGSVFNALAQTRFAAFWIAKALEDDEMRVYFEGITEAKKRRDRFIKLLTDPHLTWSDPVAIFTLKLLERQKTNNDS